MLGSERAPDRSDQFQHFVNDEKYRMAKVIIVTAAGDRLLEQYSLLDVPVRCGQGYRLVRPAPRLQTKLGC